MKDELQASTLIEVIVASVLFLIIFAITLHTITSITTHENQRYSMPQIDGWIKECLKRYSSKEYADGEYRELYPSGEISIEVSPYENHDSLKVIKIETRVGVVNTMVSYKFIVDR